MKLVGAAVAILVVSTAAHAESWYDVGVFRSRVEVNDYTAHGEMLRFGPRVMLDRTFYVGGDIDVGRITADGHTSPGVARTTTGGSTTTGEAVDGGNNAIKAVLGARFAAGALTGGLELALGERQADLHDSFRREVTTVPTMTPILEGRARLDVWLSPTISIGGQVSRSTGGEVSAAGVVVGVHFR